MLNRNDLLVGGVRPHYYCLPVVKRERHRLALRAAATSRRSALLPRHRFRPASGAAKETACGCAGVFNARVAVACYAQVFEEEGALDRFEAFASLNGPAFYGLPVNEETVTLSRQAEPVVFPARIETGAGPVTVFDPMFPLHWQVVQQA